ncbi:MAG TPA: hypothetical protein VF269_00160 [Rhodanobacteraceae bacterium]
MTKNRRVGLGAFPKALWMALQWRVMLIWIVLMALPTLIVALPVGHALGALLDHSLASTALAQKFHGLQGGDALFLLMQHDGAAIGGATLAGLIVTLLLSPFLTGVVVTAVRGPRRSTLGELMHGGLAQYWRMLRLMLWSLVPYIIALIIGSVAYSMAGAHAAQAILQSSADRGYHAALILLLVLLVLTNAIMEASRAQVAAEGSMHSATRAFGRGIAMLVRRPLATLGLYLGTSIIGFVLAGLVGMLRIHTNSAGAAGLIVAIVLTQLIVIILTWMRLARIGALAMLARATPFRGGSSVAALAPA